MVEIVMDPEEAKKYGIRTVSESLVYPKDTPEPVVDEFPPQLQDTNVWGFKTPTFWQAVAIPFYDVPRTPGVSGPIWKDPKLVDLKSDLKKCTVFMVLVPLLTFYYVRITYRELLTPDEDMYAGLAAIFATQLTMLCISVWKYWEDF